MTRQEFIDILDKEGIAYSTDTDNTVYIDGILVVGHVLAYVMPDHKYLCGFNTEVTETPLEDLMPEDLEPMIAHYRRFHPKEADNADTKPSCDGYVTVSKEELEQLKAENARLKDVLERHGIKLLK